jgi:adenylate kinase
MAIRTARRLTELDAHKYRRKYDLERKRRKEAEKMITEHIRVKVEAATKLNWMRNNLSTLRVFEMRKELAEVLALLTGTTAKMW